MYRSSESEVVPAEIVFDIPSLVMYHTNSFASRPYRHLGESFLMRRVEFERALDVFEVDVPLQGLVSVVTEEGQVDDPS